AAGTECSARSDTNGRGRYGEEEVCSDRLDTDFPDIDLSQLDTSDFDSVNCLSELQWCNDQSANASPASIHYSTADELFEIEEENAALLAALTDSLDGIVDAEVGGLSVFPALGEEPSQEEEDGLSLSAEDFSQPLGSETEDPSLVRTQSGVKQHQNCFSCLYSESGPQFSTSPSVIDVPQERKPRAVRPAGRLCTELHRHLTTTEDTAAPDTEEEDEEEEDEDSESEEEEEEEESSSSEAEGAASVAAAPVEAPKPQFSSEKELQSVVELIRYMHTYCLPSRKQQGWDRKDRDLLRSRARPEAPRSPATTSHSRVVLVAASTATRKLPFARRREMKADSLLRTLLQQSSSFDVSKPYRLHRPPYSHLETPERRSHSSEPPRSLEKTADCSGSFSVRRSRRLASFPSRFAKRLRPERAREEDRKEGRVGLKLPPTQAGGEKRDGDVEGKANVQESQYSTKAFEQTLSVDLCGTAGLTPPTTPPHKPVEDELFKPADGGKGGGGGGGSEPAHPASNSSAAAKTSSWASRAHHQRKLPEQTELYAQLRRMGQASEADAHRGFGDHDYCLLSLGESRKRSAAIFGAMLQGRAESERQLCARPPLALVHTSFSILYCPLSSLLPWFPCCQDNCQVFYIHNLPSSVTQNMLRKRFQIFGKAEDCKVIICNDFALCVSDEAGPGPVKSKYDAMDFDTLLKEAQKSLHR
uniref:Peroxisome proliferator-activated receptor gamma, coactivator 1 beta n=1 Tax=Haplochromis burtoni TaxID=8153 RepID=A0A3Q3C8A2_HAPBU